MRRLRLHRPRRPPPLRLKPLSPFPNHPHLRRTGQLRRPKMWNRPAKQSKPPEAGEAVEHAEQPEPPGSGMILVSRQPVAVLASPSSSAPTMYGFPAGRPFRVIGHDGGFAQYPGAAGLTRSARAAATQFRPPRLRLKRSLSQSGETLQTRRPVRSQKRPTVGSLPTPKQPLNIAGAPAYLVEEVSLAASSATVTSLGTPASLGPLLALKSGHGWRRHRCPLSARSSASLRRSGCGVLRVT